MSRPRATLRQAMLLHISTDLTQLMVKEQVIDPEFRNDVSRVKIRDSNSAVFPLL